MTHHNAQKCSLDEEDSKHYFIHCPIYASQQSLFKYINDNTIPITLKNLPFESDNSSLQDNFCYLIKFIPLSKLQTDSRKPCKHVYKMCIEMGNIAFYPLFNFLYRTMLYLLFPL